MAMEMESCDHSATLFKELFGKHRKFQECFVKNITGSMLTSHMQVPSKESHIFKRYVSKKMTLQVAGGKEWHVGVRQNNAYFIFGRGWQPFVCGNSLNVGDQVYFFYVGNGRFCVAICPYDESRKLRRGREASHKRRRRFGSPEVASSDNTNYKPAKKSKRCVKVFQTEEVKSPLERSPLFLQRNFKRQPHEALEPELKPELEVEDTTETVCRTTVRSFIFPLKRVDYDVVDVERTLAKEFLSEAPMRMFLVDTTGKKWQVKWFGWKRCALAFGWVDFVVHHQLQGGDLCRFQLKNSDTFVVRVYKLSPRENTEQIQS